MVTAAPQGILATWLQTPRATKALLVGILVNRLAGFIQLFLVLFLTHRGFTPAQAGLALSLYGAGAVLGTFVGGAASDRLSPRSATLLSMVGSAVLILSILYVSIYPLLLAAVLLVSAIGQLYRPAAQTLITELTPRAQLVMVTAMYRLAMNLGATAAPLLGAALVSVSYNLLFWGEALAALTYGAIATLALPAGRPSSAAAAAAGGPAAAGSRGRYLELLAAVGDTILVCSPHEETWLENMRDHGQRVYMSSAAPYLYQTPGWQPMRGYTAQALRGDFAGAQETAATLGPVRAAAGKWLAGRHRQIDNIASIKAWAGLLGMSGGTARPPLPSLTARERDELAADLAAAGLRAR